MTKIQNASVGRKEKKAQLVERKLGFCRKQVNQSEEPVTAANQPTIQTFEVFVSPRL